jgi:hypothetical protein
MIESGDGKRTGQMEVLRFGHLGLVKGVWV